uniref:Family with sequence similarity 110 member A n=1 Tax=Gadus morhua TaxID=8049 RepID=A0A8C4ZXJ6_GADMO
RVLLSTTMPVETLPSPLRQSVRMSLTPPRLRPKAPLGPAFNRPSPLPAPRPRQSAVERLEADKAKYVKSQVALSKQQPVHATEPQKAPLNPTTVSTDRRPPQTWKHLSNLISGVNDGPAPAAPTPTAAGEGRSRGGPTRGSPLRGPIRAEHREVRSSPPPATPDWSSPAKVRLKACGPVKPEAPQSQDAALPPATATIRRVDVVPQSRNQRKPPARPMQYMRQPLYPMTWQGLHPLRPATSNLGLFPQRTSSSSSSAPPPPPPGLLPPPLQSSSPLVFPPSSPAVTRLSSSSSRKRPSLTRSKSDMSDRCSRAGTELERFFNLCGLDPSEVQELAVGPGSDIVSLARFRSASAPGSECQEGEEEEDDAEEGGGAARVPYGVSVIERNARVIKWLYNIRQEAKDSKSTNM